jgi:cytidylate kinase
MNATILTVSGLIGSGKTSVCRELSQLTGWRVVSAGTILRRMAEERGLSVIELNEIAKTDGSIDKLIDDQLIGLRNSGEPLIVDSRLAWHFIPNAYKIHLVVDTDIAADRVFRAQRSDESYATPEDAYAANAKRQMIENERFQQYYGIDCEDWRNYDLVLDSSTLPPARLAECMKEAVEGPAPKGSCWLSPRLVLTGEGAGENGAPEISVIEGRARAVSGARVLEQARALAEPLVRGRLVSYEGQGVRVGS